MPLNLKYETWKDLETHIPNFTPEELKTFLQGENMVDAEGKMLPAGKSFMEDCLNEYGVFVDRNGTWFALSFDTSPASYPRVEKDKNKAWNKYLVTDDRYWADLTEAIELERRMFLEDDPVGDLPAFAKRSCCAAALVCGRGNRPRWDYSSQDSHQYLLASISGIEITERNRGSWGAVELDEDARSLSDIFYDLLYANAFAWYFNRAFAPECIMYRWRENLAYSMDEALFEMLKRLGDPKPVDWREFGAKSDANLEKLPQLCWAVENNLKRIERAVAEKMRCRGFIVVPHDESFACVINNGAELSTPSFKAELDTYLKDKTSPLPEISAWNTAVATDNWIDQIIDLEVKCLERH